MSSVISRVLTAAALIAAFVATQSAGQAGALRATYAAVGASTSMPYGWMEFCKRTPGECVPAGGEALDADLTRPQAWKTLERINAWVNANIEPVSDMDHHGLEDRWSYPDDGKGDCEDYVLLKRRLLANAGFPIQSLLITVVRDERDEGHAILTVKSNTGEFVLDNKRGAILPWSESGYRFVKRQSQTDPNVWVSLGEPSRRTVAATPVRRATP